MSIGLQVNAWFNYTACRPCRISGVKLGSPRMIIVRCNTMAVVELGTGYWTSLKISRSGNIPVDM